MGKKLMPQMRILVTDFCDSKCVYCRPTGEGNILCAEKKMMTLETAKTAAQVYKENGGNEIKISGGDPVFWPYLVEFIFYLKKELKFKKVEVITRSEKILTIVEKLIDAGLDVLNFSLDTIDNEKYTLITGKKDFESYILAIKECASKVYCKINMVVMQNLNSNDWYNMILFCENVGIKQLKLLDFIDDLLGKLNDPEAQEKYFYSFDKICKELRERYGNEKIVYQGGLGHPMNKFNTPKDLEVICKNSKNGAWYCKECINCPNYPCHDALMAVRVTPSDSFQLCLLNEKKHWYFNSETVSSQFKCILKNYQSAFFVGDNL